MHAAAEIEHANMDQDTSHHVAAPDQQVSSPESPYPPTTTENFYSPVEIPSEPNLPHQLATELATMQLYDVNTHNQLATARASRNHATGAAQRPGRLDIPQMQPEEDEEARNQVKFASHACSQNSNNFLPSNCNLTLNTAIRPSAPTNNSNFANKSSNFNVTYRNANPFNFNLSNSNCQMSNQPRANIYHPTSLHSVQNNNHNQRRNENINLMQNSQMAPENLNNQFLNFQMNNMNIQAINVVPKFDDGIHPVMFVKKLEDAIQTYNINFSRFSIWAYPLFTGSSKLFADALLESFSDFESFKVAFLRNFWSSTKQIEARNILETGRHKFSDGTYCDYFLKMLTLAKYLQPPYDPTDLIMVIGRHFNQNIAASLIGAVSISEAMTRLQQADYLQRGHREHSETQRTDRPHYEANSRPREPTGPYQSRNQPRNMNFNGNRDNRRVNNINLQGEEAIEPEYQSGNESCSR